MSRPELHISVDVEADGPVPGLYSMLSIGAAVASELRDGELVDCDPERENFYAELEPLPNAAVQAEALAVAERGLRGQAADPRFTMAAFAHWVSRMSNEHGGARPVLVAWPLTFDWQFAYHYLMRFVPAGSPFGFSGALCIKGLYAARAGVPVARATKSRVPAHLKAGCRAHTHNALDDAIGQAVLFRNVWRWEP